MKKQVSVLWLVLIQWVLAFEWIQSGWGKFASSSFMDGIAKTLGGFAAKTQFGFYSDFLKSTALQNPTLFGNVVRFSEVLAGLAFALGGLWLLKFGNMPKILTIGMVVAFYGAALLNANFWFAAGWSSPSTAGINMVMGLIEAVLGTFYLSTLFHKKDAKKK